MGYFSKIWPGLLLTALFACLATGCGYSTRGLYPSDLRTVAVPIFTSDGLRRDVEFALTERVIHAIEARTPFKVVAADNAETILIGAIHTLAKRPFGEDPEDNPRGGEMYMEVNIRWVDAKTGKTLNKGNVELADYGLFTQQAFTIDIGESITTANSKANDQIANYVVTLMQAPW